MLIICVLVLSTPIVKLYLNNDTVELITTDVSDIENEKEESPIAELEEVKTVWDFNSLELSQVEYFKKQTNHFAQKVWVNFSQEILLPPPKSLS